MGVNTSCMPDECRGTHSCDGTRSCKKVGDQLEQPCRFTEAPEDSFGSFIVNDGGTPVWATSALGLEVTTISKGHLSLRLTRLAQYEEDPDSVECYADVLNCVLELLATPRPPGAPAFQRSRRDGGGQYVPVLVAVAPEEDMQEYLEYCEPDVVVLTREPEARYRVHDEQFRKRLEEGRGTTVSASPRRGEVPDGGSRTFAVSHDNGEVIASDARFSRRRDGGLWCADTTRQTDENQSHEEMNACDVAAALGRGAVFERNAMGEVYVYPCADMQRGQAWHVGAPGAPSLPAEVLIGANGSPPPPPNGTQLQAPAAISVQPPVAAGLLNGRFRS